jgi:hypothetical protein
MNSVTIDPEVAVRLENYQQSEIEPEIRRIVNDALREYLRSLERQKLRREQEAFEEQYLQLKHEYLGRYVAFHKGQLVDVDENERALYIRVHQRFPNTVIGIFPVDETSPLRVHRHLSTRLSPPNQRSGS